MNKVFFTMILVFSCFMIKAQQIDALIQEEGVLVKEENDTVLFYHTKNHSLNGLDSRSNYIHPVYGLNGEILTENYPVDHPHHRGIFWAWHQLYIGNQRIGDGWDMKDIRYEVDSVWINKNKGSVTYVYSKVLWKSPLWLDEKGVEKPLIKEKTQITVYPKTENFRFVDIKIFILALEDSMKIGGSENEKGYGGFSYRIKLAKDMQFVSSSGTVEPTNLPLEAGPWMDLSGSIGKNNSIVGLTVLCHSDNPSPVDKWILRRSKSMQNAVYPGRNAVSISKINPTVLKYRLVIHNGSSTDINLSDIYKDFILTK